MPKCDFNKVEITRCILSKTFPKEYINLSLKAKSLKILGDEIIFIAIPRYFQLNRESFEEIYQIFTYKIRA